jgi:lipid II:glycine glycyltransferase (peptidoglycan interpeptide bridge formation enzyme)
MEFKEIKNQEKWDNKSGSVNMSQFLQSWQWGEFQRKLGRKVWHLEINGEHLLIIRMPLPYNKNYLYIPRTNVKIDDNNLKRLKELAVSEKSLFIRIEPVSQILAGIGFKKVQVMQPQKTLVLDLSKNEEDLLKDMHSKTRYNIRLADKKGVEIRDCDAAQFDLFYDLLLQTYQRKGKKLFSKEHYSKLFDNIITKVYLAEYNNKLLVANLVIFYGDTVTYLHGGSSEEDKNVMAPHLLQWQVIKKAKELGYKYYDFWGIEDRYPGVARFKRGFSGTEIRYPGTFDLPINKLWYTVYKIVKRFK